MTRGRRAILIVLTGALVVGPLTGLIVGAAYSDTLREGGGGGGVMGGIGVAAGGMIVALATWAAIAVLTLAGVLVWLGVGRLRHIDRAERVGTDREKDPAADDPAPTGD